MKRCLCIAHAWLTAYTAASACLHFGGFEVTRGWWRRGRAQVRASYLQIYNEVISDLLKPERTNLHIREEKRRGIFVEGLSEWVVRSSSEIYGLMQRGAAQRAVGSTRLNEISSRSHAVFMIITENVTVHEGDSAHTPNRLPSADGQNKVSQSFKVRALACCAPLLAPLCAFTVPRHEKWEKSPCVLAPTYASATTAHRFAPTRPLASHLMPA